MKMVLASYMFVSSVALAQNYSADDLARRTIERRAVEAVIWGMPLVNTDAMRQAYFRDIGAKYNDICYFSTPADWRFQVTTPNASTNYVYFNFNLKNGPVVLDVPPAVGAGLLGVVVDAWDAGQADVGPAGEDQGKGGKYLLVPPDVSVAPPAGYIPVRFQTFNGYGLLRAIPAGSTAADMEASLNLVKKLRLYPFAQAANPPAQRFIDIHGKTFDGVARFDDTFFDSLARMVLEEPVQTRDLAMMGMLKSIGIEKGKPFSPDAATRTKLKAAVEEAKAFFLDKMTNYSNRWWPDRRWSTLDASGSSTGWTFQTSDMLDIDERGRFNFAAFGLPKKAGTAGQASFYLITYRDKNGVLLSGENTYVLHIPPDVPAKQYWSAIAYDVQTSAFVREAPVISLDSYNQGLKKNADGSIDLYFGPKAPPGRESNWITTAPKRGWFVAFRLYDPDKPLFDRTWKLPDIEQISAR